MSAIVPGPQKKNDDVLGSPSGAPRLTPGSAKLPSVEKPPAVEIAGWPPALRKVVEDDFRRTSALAGNRRRTADAAVADVVQGLDELLDLAADRIRAASSGRVRRRKAAEPSQLEELPLDEVADLLGIPADEVTELNPERRKALRAIKHLRGQLQQLEVSKDHARLNRLVSFTLRTVLVLDTASTPDDSQAIPTAVAGLACLSLDRVTTATHDTWRDHDPATIAVETHQALLTTLSPAEEHERTLMAFRLQVRIARAWVACFQLDRPFTEKLEYWQALDEIPDAIRDRSTDDLKALHQRLEALAPPHVNP